MALVCPSFVLGGDANTGSAGYVCLETELVDGALMGWPSCIVADCPAVPVAAFRVYALLCCALRGSLSFLGACCELSDGYGGYACCVAYSLEFSFGAGSSFC